MRLTPAGKIDELVFARLKKLGLQPSPLCSDAVFVRRVYLDVIGTLPTAAEAKRVPLGSQIRRSGSVLIDRLLERDERADYWAMKWSDLLRIKAEFPINLWPNAAQAYYHWLRTSIRDNKPYDRFARELLTSSGSNFRVPPVNFYRADPEPAAGGHRPVGRLGADGRAGGKMAQGTAGGHGGLLRQDRLQIDRRVERGDRLLRSGGGVRPAAGSTRTATALRAKRTPVLSPTARPLIFPPDRDPREVFADWLIDGRNPWFARNIVNRIWCWFEAAASSTSRTTSGPTTRRAIPSCWRTWRKSWSPRTTT